MTLSTMVRDDGATVAAVMITEPEFTIVLTHHETGRPGDCRHNPDGCTGAAGGSDRREAFWSEMHTLPPCQRCLLSYTNAIRRRTNEGMGTCTQ